MTTLAPQAKKLTGTVVSTKMQGTIIVVVERYEKHPRYGKFIRSKKQFKVDAKSGSCKEGDRVTIVSCRPLSKDKHFKLFSVDKSSVEPPVPSI